MKERQEKEKMSTRKRSQQSNSPCISQSKSHEATAMKWGQSHALAFVHSQILAVISGIGVKTQRKSCRNTQKFLEAPFNHFATASECRFIDFILPIEKLL
jgi:hypothetical protein